MDIFAIVKWIIVGVASIFLTLIGFIGKKLKLDYETRQENIDKNLEKLTSGLAALDEKIQATLVRQEDKFEAALSKIDDKYDKELEDLRLDYMKLRGDFLEHKAKTVTKDALVDILKALEITMDTRFDKITDKLERYFVENQRELRETLTKVYENRK